MFEWLRGVIRRPSLGFLATVLVTKVSRGSSFRSPTEAKLPLTARGEI